MKEGGYGSDPETELPILRFDSLSGQWIQLGFKSCLVKATAVRISKHKMWVIGGKAKGQRLATVTEVDLATGQQTLLSLALSRPKSGVGAVYLDGRSLVTQALSTS